MARNPARTANTHRVTWGSGSLEREFAMNWMVDTHNSWFLPTRLIAKRINCSVRTRRVSNKENQRKFDSTRVLTRQHRGNAGEDVVHCHKQRAAELNEGSAATTRSYIEAESACASGWGLGRQKMAWFSVCCVVRH